LFRKECRTLAQGPLNFRKPAYFLAKRMKIYEMEVFDGMRIGKGRRSVLSTKYVLFYSTNFVPNIFL
jgi:hypothetical protein